MKSPKRMNTTGCILGDGSRPSRSSIGHDHHHPHPTPSFKKNNQLDCTYIYIYIYTLGNMFGTYLLPVSISNRNRETFLWTQNTISML
jgi:hypothetical protein